MDVRRGLPRPLCCFLLLFKIGLFTFGGGWSIVAQLQREFVDRRGWISKEEVLAVYEELKKNQYGQYLKDVLDGKYLDVLH